MWNKIINESPGRNFGKAIVGQPFLLTNKETKDFRRFRELLITNKDQIPEVLFIFSYF